jgi:hypothetical protein
MGVHHAVEMHLSNDETMSERQNNAIISRFLLCAAVALSANIVPSLGFSQANKINPVSMKGVLLIQWSDETRFIYVSPADNPLRFTRSGREVQPGRMYTDGGSISTRILVG